LKNFRISKVLWSVASLVFIVLTVSGILNYRSISHIQSLTKEKRTEILPHAFNFINLKIDVIQVQQWLTDVSATRAHKGFDDGFDEAKKYYDDANKILDFVIAEHIKYNEPEMVADLKAFKSLALLNAMRDFDIIAQDNLEDVIC